MNKCSREERVISIRTEIWRVTRINGLGRRLFSALMLIVSPACSHRISPAAGIDQQPPDAAGSQVLVAREAAAQVPSPTIGLSGYSSRQRLLRLDGATSGQLDWYSEDRIFIATRNGRITRTVGLPGDLGGTRTLSRKASETGEIIYALDFPDLDVFGAPAYCTRQDWGDERVKILGANIRTRHFVEHCSVAALNWVFDNEYWEDPATLYVWRSCQYIHPRSSPVVLEVFRSERPQHDTSDPVTGTPSAEPSSDDSGETIASGTC